MIKVDGTTSSNNTSPVASPTVQAPAGKSYLLNEPIKDEVSFSAAEEQPKKKNNILAWGVGLAAVATGIYFLVKKGNAKELEKTVTEGTKTTSKESGRETIYSRSNSGQNPTVPPFKAREFLYHEYNKVPHLNSLENFNERTTSYAHSVKQKEIEAAIADFDYSRNIQNIDFVQSANKIVEENKAIDRRTSKTGHRKMQIALSIVKDKRTVKA